MKNAINVLGKNYNGEVNIPGDKSISIRAILLANFFNGDFNIKNLNTGLDTKATIKCMNDLYQYTNFYKKNLTKNCVVDPLPLILDCKNSATLMRLLTGILVSAYHCTNLRFILKGDKSLTNRPMDRIINPLQKMGFDVTCKNNKPPIYINFTGIHKHIKNFSYSSRIPSAQIKSCLKLAAHFSKIKLKYTEPAKSRNHTEIMLKYFKNPSSKNYLIPGDFSVASTIITNAIIQKILYTKNSNIQIKNVCVNNTRTGFLKSIKKMGIKFDIRNIRSLQGEKTADIHFSTKKLTNYKGININKNDVPSMIDELPQLILLSFFADTNSSFNGIEELRNKESDRAKAILDISSYLSKKNKKALSRLLKSTDHRILMLLKILHINNFKNKSYLYISI